MHSTAFPRSVRLLTPADYKAVFDDARYRASTQHGLLLATPSTAGHSRLGLVIAKKHIRLAVHRNRIKRLAREHFRTHQLPVNCDMVFLARAKLGELDNAAINALLESLWDKLSKRLPTS